MNFIVKRSLLGNYRVFFSRLGYHSAPNGSFERRCSTMRFPRFHAYVEDAAGEQIRISVHIDQKQHSYEGSAMHSGEYNGELVEKECARINNALLPE